MSKLISLWPLVKIENLNDIQIINILRVDFLSGQPIPTVSSHLCAQWCVLAPKDSLFQYPHMPIKWLPDMTEKRSSEEPTSQPAPRGTGCVPCTGTRRCTPSSICTSGPGDLMFLHTVYYYTVEAV